MRSRLKKLFTQFPIQQLSRPLRTPVLVHDVHMSIYYLLHFIHGLFTNALTVFDW